MKLKITFLTDWFASDRIANFKALFHIILSDCNNVTSDIKNDIFDRLIC